jgi:hypothetical protein
VRKCYLAIVTDAKGNIPSANAVLPKFPLAEKFFAPTAQLISSTQTIKVNK